MDSISKAFVLAAGLGTRLRPLTDQLPKPLIPVGHKPLITFAFDHLIADAGVEEFVVNTHHLPGTFQTAFPEGRYRGCPISFRHEPVLLETGGGIKNVADLLRDAPFLVYNGDILTDLPIEPLIARHKAGDNLITLALRSATLSGPGHISLDPKTGRILDIRNLLGTGAPANCSFACVYIVEPGFLEMIPGEGKVVSVIPSFLELIRRGGLGGVVIDEGEWRDLGNRDEYLRAHRDLHAEHPPVFPRYGAPDPEWRNWVHPAATLEAGAEIRAASVVGPGARVGEGAIIEDSILWPGAKISPRSHLKNCIVRASQNVDGRFEERDF